MRRSPQMQRARWVLLLALALALPLRAVAAPRGAARAERQGTELAVYGAEGATVLLDGRVAGALPLPRPLLVPEGDHEVALARGELRVAARLTLRGQRSVEVRFTLVPPLAVVTPADAAVAAEPAPPPPPPPPPPLRPLAIPPPPVAPPPPRALRAGAFAVLGLGLAEIAVGAILVGLDGRQGCERADLGRCHLELDSAGAGVGLLVAGGVTLATAGVLIALHHREGRRRAAPGAAGAAPPGR